MKKLFFLLFILTNLSIQAQEIAQSAFREGVKLLKANEFEEAEKQFTIAIENGEVKEGLKMSYIYRGFALNGQKKYDKAITNFNEAIKIDSTDAASYTDRGLAFLYNQDNENAILDFEKVLTLDSVGQQAEAAYYYLGRIKSIQYKLEDAINYFDKLIELMPTNAEAYFLRGTVKSNMMDIDGSIADFDLAIKYHPNYMEAYANRGVQKINKILAKDKIGKKINCIEEPCADLLKAKELGDTTVDDMIFLYCKKCK